MYQTPFVQLGWSEQDTVLLTLRDARPPAAEDIWRRMSIHYFWLLLVQDVVAVYYAHPYAWDEIGFGGPAYPRGYMRLTGGAPEPWEVDEQRYAWDAPATVLSELRTRNFSLMGNQQAVDHPYALTSLPEALLARGYQE